MPYLPVSNGVASDWRISITVKSKDISGERSVGEIEISAC
jgi:hypothetical protein